MAAFAVICDDLTGAMEIGLHLYRRGLTAEVVLDGQVSIASSDENRAVVITTDTRNTSPTEAAERVGMTLRELSRAGLELVYKKIDSTLRGNLGTELDVCSAWGCLDLIVLAPALPGSGRITQQGCHSLLGGKLDDPLSPISDPFIPALLQQQTKLMAEVIDLETVRQGSEPLSQVFTKLKERGCQVAVVDAVVEQDLRIIAAAIEKSALRLLPCGSAGLFAELKLPFQVRAWEAKESEQPGETRRGPLLILSGSPSPVTKEQIRLAKDRGVPLITWAVDPGRARSELELELAEVVQQVVGYLQQGRSVIVDGAAPSREELASRYPTREGLLAASQQVTRWLARCLKGITSEVLPAGVMVVGGDTAREVCRELRVPTVRLINEVEPLVPVGRILIQDQALPFITKAGGLGSPEVLRRAIGYFQAGVLG